MTNRYGPMQVHDTLRKLKVLLPPSVTVSVAAVRDGFYLSIVICGPASCCQYQLPLGVTDKKLMTIAETWATGEQIKPTSANEEAVIAHRALEAPVVEDYNGFATWFRAAKKRERVIYFRGELAAYRFNMPRRIVQLQAQADNRKGTDPAPLHERMELAKLLATRELLEIIDKLVNGDMIQLVQHRHSDGSGATYYAVKG